MNIRQIQILLIAILLFVPGLRAEGRDSLLVSTVTCWPGAEIYELCGHEAIRVRTYDTSGPAQGQEARLLSDSVWNYGLFDFAQPNFVYRFVKGQTDYMVAGYPTAWFLPEYIQSGRRVEEHELNLTQQEARDLQARLRRESLPANRVYRYNYVKDNCATRITDRLRESVPQHIVFPDSVRYGTFRREMRAYHKDYPWYQFGIDICLGSGIDLPIDAVQEMFVPVEMHRNYASAHLADGRPLVSRTTVLNEGSEGAARPPTSAWLTPLAVSLYILALATALAVWQWRRRRIVRWAYTLWFGVLGMMGLLVTFLVFVSTHEATSPNLLILWLNPLQFVIALGVWWRSWRPAVTAMACVNGILLLLLAGVWPFQTQSANAAFWPMMATTFLMSVEYAIIRYKNGYNKNKDEEVSDLGAGSGRHRGSRAGGRRKATSRGGNRR